MAIAGSFESDVRVAKGLRPIAQHGKLTIADGTATLLGSNGSVIASAPVGQVSAKRMKFPLSGLRIEIAGTKYNLDAASSGAGPLGRARVAGQTASLANGLIAYLASVNGKPSA